jgi:rhomboid family protein
VTRIFRHDPLNFAATPPAVKWLIAANVACYILTLMVGPGIYDLFGLVPQHLIFDRWVWQPITYLFLHGGIWHLLINMFVLWMFGMPVEAQWGAKETLKFYFLCGLGAALTSSLVHPHSMIPVIGASGAIFGLLVAFAMLYPDAVVYVYFLIPMKAAHFAILCGVLEFFAGTTGSMPGLAHFAHLGGAVTGYLYIRWWWVWKVRAKGFARGLFEREDAPAPSPRPRAFPPRRPRAEPPPADPMAEVDRILDKILASGLESLTDEERDVMRRYSPKKDRPS